jgi:hypothetical protein
MGGKCSRNTSGHVNFFVVFNLCFAKEKLFTLEYNLIAFVRNLVGTSLLN